MLAVVLGVATFIVVGFGASFILESPVGYLIGLFSGAPLGILVHVLRRNPSDRQGLVNRKGFFLFVVTVLPLISGLITYLDGGRTEVIIATLLFGLIAGIIVLVKVPGKQSSRLNRC